jgi:hypothetical protein
MAMIDPQVHGYAATAPKRPWQGPWVAAALPMTKTVGRDARRLPRVVQPGRIRGIAASAGTACMASHEGECRGRSCGKVSLLTDG